MKTSRATEIARGLGAALLLLGIVVVPPLALSLVVGWPLPRSVPEWDKVTDALGGSSVSDAFLLKTLACACWLVWLALVASVFSEVTAWVGGRAADPLPVARAFQPAIRRLVMAATLLVAVQKGSAAPVAFPTAVPALAMTAAPAASIETQAPPTAEASAVLPTCVVQPRDSLWRLAEEHLGDGMRWRDIWELNRDRSQVDGGTFTDPNLIHPGWVLTMPADAGGLAPAVALPPSPEPTVPEALPETSPPAQVPPPPATAPDTTGVTTADTTPSTADSTERRATTADDPDYDIAPLLAGVALTAAGVVLSLDRLRRRQVRHGARHRPPPRLRPDEVSLRRAADLPAYARLDLVLRNLAHQLALSATAPRIDVVSVGPNGVEILLDDISDAPTGPFEVTAEGRAWTLRPSVGDDELLPVAIATTGPAPALAPVGTVDDRIVSVNLESAPVTVVNGDPGDASALLWTMVTDLATSERADDIEIVVVGQAPAGVDGLDRVKVVSTVDAAVTELAGVVARTEQDLASIGAASVHDARMRGAADGAPPTVVVVPDADDTSVAGLVALARRGVGIAVLATGEIERSDRELCVEDDTLLVKPLGVSLTPASMPTATVQAAAELLAEATVLDLTDAVDVQDLAVASPDGPHGFAFAYDEDGDPIVPDGHVVVRVQGGVEVFGGARSIDRRRSTEFVVFLALHPDGANEEQIREALWPEHDPTRSAFNETISRARRALGLDADGDHHVRHCEHGIYRLGPYVHLETSRPARPGDQLTLPFRGCKGYEWAYVEGIAYALEQPAGDAHAATPVRTAPTPPFEARARTGTGG